MNPIAPVERGRSQAAINNPGAFSLLYKAEVDSIYRYVAIRVSSEATLEIHVAEAFLTLFSEMIRGAIISDPRTFLEAVALRSARRTDYYHIRTIEGLAAVDTMDVAEYVLPSVNCAIFLLLESIVTEKEAECILLLYFIGLHSSGIAPATGMDGYEVDELIKSGLRTLMIWQPCTKP